MLPWKLYGSLAFYWSFNVKYLLSRSNLRKFTTKTTTNWIILGFHGISVVTLIYFRLSEPAKLQLFLFNLSHKKTYALDTTISPLISQLSILNKIRAYCVDSI